MYTWYSQPVHTNGHGQHRVADDPEKDRRTFDTGYSQQQAWPVTTSTGVGPGQAFDRPTNSGTTEPPYQHPFDYAGMIPTAPAEIQYQTYGWQNDDW